MEGNVALWAAGVGTGLIMLGTGLGIGRLSAAALEGTSRQPAASSDLRLSMLLGASYIEGAALFGMIINLLIVYA